MKRRVSRLCLKSPNHSESKSWIFLPEKRQGEVEDASDGFFVLVANESASRSDLTSHQ